MFDLNDGVDLAALKIVSVGTEAIRNRNWKKLLASGWLERKKKGVTYFVKNKAGLRTLDDPTKHGITYFNSLNAVHSYIQAKLNLNPPKETDLADDSSSEESADEAQTVEVPLARGKRERRPPDRLTVDFSSDKKKMKREEISTTSPAAPTPTDPRATKPATAAVVKNVYEMQEKNPTLRTNTSITAATVAPRKTIVLVDEHNMIRQWPPAAVPSYTQPLLHYLPTSSHNPTNNTTASYAPTTPAPLPAVRKVSFNEVTVYHDPPAVHTEPPTPPPQSPLSTSLLESQPVKCNPFTAPAVIPPPPEPPRHSHPTYQSNTAAVDRGSGMASTSVNSSVFVCPPPPTPPKLPPGFRFDTSGAITSSVTGTHNSSATETSNHHIVETLLQNMHTIRNGRASRGGSGSGSGSVTSSAAVVSDDEVEPPKRSAPNQQQTQQSERYNTLHPAQQASLSSSEKRIGKRNVNGLMYDTEKAPDCCTLEKAAVTDSKSTLATIKPSRVTDNKEKDKDRREDRADRAERIEREARELRLARTERDRKAEREGWTDSQRREARAARQGHHSRTDGTGSSSSGSGVTIGHSKGIAEGYNKVESRVSSVESGERSKDRRENRERQRSGSKERRVEAPAANRDSTRESASATEKRTVRVPLLPILHWHENGLSAPDGSERSVGNAKKISKQLLVPPQYRLSCSA